MLCSGGTLGLNVVCQILLSYLSLLGLLLSLLYVNAFLDPSSPLPYFCFLKNYG